MDTSTTTAESCSSCETEKGVNEFSLEELANRERGRQREDKREMYKESLRV